MDIRIQDIQLTANQDLNPFSIKYPIIWAGNIGNYPIKIIQLSPVSSLPESYDFENLPKELNGYRDKLVKIIDNYLKKKFE